jgi:hypothetical protein
MAKLILRERVGHPSTVSLPPPSSSALGPGAAS